jgi:hypothetical protein
MATALSIVCAHTDPRTSACLRQTCKTVYYSDEANKYVKTQKILKKYITKIENKNYVTDEYCNVYIFECPFELYDIYNFTEFADEYILPYLRFVNPVLYKSIRRGDILENYSADCQFFVFDKDHETGKLSLYETQYGFPIQFELVTQFKYLGYWHNRESVYSFEPFIQPEESRFRGIFNVFLPLTKFNVTIPTDEDYQKYHLHESYFVQKYTVKFQYYNELYFVTLEDFPSVKNNPIMYELEREDDWFEITLESMVEILVHRSKYAVFKHGVKIEDYMIPPYCKYTQFQSI